MADLAQLSILVEEARRLDQALANLAADGRISSMTIAGGTIKPPEEGDPPAMPMLPVTVDTRGIEYPATMVDAIRTALTSRKNEVIKELGEYGLNLPPRE